MREEKIFLIYVLKHNILYNFLFFRTWITLLIRDEIIFKTSIYFEICIKTMKSII